MTVRCPRSSRIARAGVARRTGRALLVHPPAGPCRCDSHNRGAANVRDFIQEIAIYSHPRTDVAESDAPRRSTGELSEFLQQELGPDIDDLASYEPQESFCPYPQPGVAAFRELILMAFPDTSCLGINRSALEPRVSEHKEGRAWDWKVCRRSQGGLVADLLSLLLAPDARGHAFAAVRRLGIMYIIWDSHIWGSYAADDGWRPYSGPNQHTDHVHFSFSWRGALGETSLWLARAGQNPGNST